MVFGGRLETVRGRRREIIGVAAEYFKNLGNSMFFKSFDLTRQGVSQYKFFLTYARRITPPWRHCLPRLLGAILSLKVCIW